MRKTIEVEDWKSSPVGGFRPIRTNPAAKIIQSEKLDGVPVRGHRKDKVFKLGAWADIPQKNWGDKSWKARTTRPKPWMGGKPKPTKPGVVVVREPYMTKAEQKARREAWIATEAAKTPPEKKVSGKCMWQRRELVEARKARLAAAEAAKPKTAAEWRAQQEARIAAVEASVRDLLSQANQVKKVKNI